MDSSCGMWRLLCFSLALAQKGQSEVKELDSKSLLNAVQTKTVLTEDAIVRTNRSSLQRGKHVRSFSIEGDIIKPLRQNAVTSQTRTWPKSPDGVVRIPYEISPQYDEQTRREIGRGFKEFERFTCIRFVPHTDEEDFISLQPVPGCSASVGRVGGMQLILLNRQCLEKGKGVVEHELMHSLGFWHEHTRSDRDKYIKIEWKNVWPGYEHNFLKKNTNNLKSKYDYGSILHYSRTAFSRNGQPTLTPLVDTDAVIGQRVCLSEMDLLKVNQLYNCTAYLKDEADMVKRHPLANEGGTAHETGRTKEAVRPKSFQDAPAGSAGLGTGAGVVGAPSGNGPTTAPEVLRCLGVGPHPFTYKVAAEGPALDVPGSGRELPSTACNPEPRFLPLAELHRCPHRTRAQNRSAAAPPVPSGRTAAASWLDASVPNSTEGAEFQ
ncbi:low choriolytic enzyme-like isoform X2 [Mobula hypostoma]|uniref:low choriolytic enzyme-like isoform X2 n=1 Tax=Mobula hypostoma TaxID=723540 RepID=UPI002FC2E27F